MFRTRIERERILLVLFIATAIFICLALTIFRHIAHKRASIKAVKSVEERVEELHSFYTDKYKSGINISSINLKDIHNVRVYNDRMNTGLYVEEDPLFTIEVEVVDLSIEPFEVIVFPDKIVELHK